MRLFNKNNGVGAWRSLVAHLHGVQGVPSSNLGAPTNLSVSINLRWSHEWSHFCGTTPEHRARAAGCGNDHLYHGCARGPPRRSTIDRSAPPAAATRSRSSIRRRWVFSARGVKIIHHLLDEL